MKDSYEVLGLNYTASDDEVKRAYKELLRKYHPDNYAGTNNPLAELAEEKFKEVQEAYQDIMDRRAHGDYGPIGGYQQGPYGQSGYNNGGYDQGANSGTWQQQSYQQNYQNYGNMYGRPTRYRGGDGCGTGNFCCDLWIADTLCECMGGDLCNCM
ncbi:MAG: DnaJ domain-containing protein [Lachnospiraceae bacterium]|nr:DnaJ domain-containing protein [Lachnospiraceae bacterium]